MDQSGRLRVVGRLRNCDDLYQEVKVTGQRPTVPHDQNQLASADPKDPKRPGWPEPEHPR